MPGRLAFLAVTLLVLVLGGISGWFGQPDTDDVYGSDAVQYLDCARAMGRGDVVSALNPLWSQGFPAVLAVVRPLFHEGADGDWVESHVVCLGIFLLSWLGFSWLVSEMLWGVEVDGRWVALATFCVFMTTEMCMDRVSRVGPDVLLGAFFFVACALLLRLVRRPTMETAVALGALLGAGFLAKAVFLALGCVMLAVTAAALRWRLRYVAAVGVVFWVVVLGYGAALSRAVGRPTLGESGALNYAWHVNRLAKWVHWEGGAEPANVAWAEPWMARFARWDLAPPEFGRPVHGDVLVGKAPTIFTFHATVHAAYVPYYDPPFFYEGYRNFFNWRYQLLAIARNVVHLTVAVVTQWFLVGVGILGVLGWRRRKSLNGVWPVVACAMGGIAVYLPVHVEARYVAPFLAVLAVALLAGIREPRRWMAGLLVVAFTAGLVRAEAAGWRRAAGGWSHRDHVKWRMGKALAAEGLPAGSQIGVVWWAPNLDSDWANIARVEITSEIATPGDEAAFWARSAEGQRAVLEEFRQAGAVAVVSRDAPQGNAGGWRRLGDLPMWIYRF